MDCKGLFALRSSFRSCCDLWMTRNLISQVPCLLLPTKFGPWRAVGENLRAGVGEKQGISSSLPVSFDISSSDWVSSGPSTHWTVPTVTLASARWLPCRCNPLGPRIASSFNQRTHSSYPWLPHFRPFGFSALLSLGSPVPYVKSPLFVKVQTSVSFPYWALTDEVEPAFCVFLHIVGTQ